MTPSKVLNASDPEPPKGTVVLDDLGAHWERDDEGSYGRIRWRRVDHPDFDPETWIKIAGNYGPVTIVESP